LESGFGLGLRMLDMQERKRRDERDEKRYEEDRGLRLEDRAFAREQVGLQNARADRTEKRQGAQDARQRSQDQLNILEREIDILKSQGESYLKTYGSWDKIPPELRDDFTKSVRTKRGERNTVRSQFFQPSVEEQRKTAAESWSRIQAGQMSVDDLSDGDLTKTLTVQTRRDLGDFLDGPDGQPSIVRQATMDFEAGMQTGNQDLLIKGINVLLAPELKTGIGQDGPDGNEIVGKEIVQLVPHPEDPSRVVPIVKVTVRRDDGAVGSYMAPITENRSSDPNDNVRSISLKEGFERVGQLMTLNSAINRPDLKKRVTAGQKVAGKENAEFLQQFYGIGGAMPQRKVERKTVNLGGVMLDRVVDKDTGEIVEETRLPVSARPRAPGRSTETSAKERGVAAALARGDITAEEALKARRGLALGNSSGDDGKPMPAAALKLQQAELDAIGLAGGSKADLAALAKQLEAGKLDLGPIDNLYSRGRNAVGASTENSRAFNTFRATLEKLRNDSLRLNKGVQTEGDAQRAWNEVVTNITDAKLVAKRLREIEKINDRAILLRQMNIDTIRANYGKDPLDTSKFAQQEAALGQGDGPPAGFNAKGRDAAADFKRAREVLQQGGDPSVLGQRLRSAGYPQAAVEALIEGAQ
jgi:hypothetical protein